MKHTFKKRIGLLVFSILFLGISSASVQAFDHPMTGKRNFGMKMLNRLNLSESQQTRVNEILTKHQEETEAIRARLHEARQQLHSAISTDQFNETGVRQAWQQLSPLLEEMMVLRATVMSSVKSVLTPDQLNQYEQLKTTHLNKMRERRQMRKDIFRE